MDYMYVRTDTRMYRVCLKIGSLSYAENSRWQFHVQYVAGLKHLFL